MEQIATTVKGAGVALGVSRSTVYLLISSGDLSTTKIGRRTLVHVASVRSLLDARAR